MRQLAEEGRTMVVVTHEMPFAAGSPTRIVFMDGGTIVEQGPPAEVLFRPQQPRTQAFLSRIQQR
jgi:polar amino acid transport system ATP-binding protein